MLAGSAQALPLLVNGDFEGVSQEVGEIFGTPLDSLNRWDVYDGIPGWTTTEGAGIEIQTSGVVTQAHSGRFYIELDSHPHGPDSNSAMTQWVELAQGIHTLSFYYQPRTSREDDNGIEVLFDGASVGSADGVRTAGTDWVRYSFALDVEAAGEHSITFRAFGKANTLGGFIDTVALEPPPITQVPEPGTATLMGLGLAGLAVSGRRR